MTCFSNGLELNNNDCGPNALQAFVMALAGGADVAFVSLRGTFQTLTGQMEPPITLITANHCLPTIVGLLAFTVQL